MLWRALGCKIHIAVKPISQFLFESATSDPFQINTLNLDFVCLNVAESMFGTTLERRVDKPSRDE
jgi:hypothetical protein